MYSSDLKAVYIRYYYYYIIVIKFKKPGARFSKVPKSDLGLRFS